MRFCPATPEAVREAAALIRTRGLVVFPTETVYGLGANALDPLAVARIFEAKDRPRFDPLIVHIADVASAPELCRFDERARALAARFWPGPLTVVLEKMPVVPEIVTAGLTTVAIRMPAHPAALALIGEAGVPVAAPSANRFGWLSPTTAEHARDQLGRRVDMILDGGPCPVGVESTVLDLTAGVPVLLRPGGLPVEDLEEVVGSVKAAGGGGESPRSPGQLPRHYSPRTPVRILGHGSKPPARGQPLGLLCLRPPSGGEPGHRFERVEALSARGELREAAANLFSALHRLDQAGLHAIYVEPVPEAGLGRAIMDRLRRAAARGTT